ncbi:hypothetical protein Q7P37_004732 [Cladosporium fusiforme]
MKLPLLHLSLSLASLAVASFPPTPEDVTTKHIDHVPGASITYKETHICETKAKAYAGYVNMPAEYLSDIQGDEPYNLSTFFWYFQARHSPDKAPTTIYLAGGPGESSLYGVTSDSGPCFVLDDSNSTATNPWSWNENVNMIYVDQPATAGFSYTEAVKSTLDLLWSAGTTDTPIVPFEDYNGSVPAENATFIHGTLPEQNPNHVANNSVIASRALWHFAQLWFTEFPEHHTCDDRINLAGNSYGGYWVSTSMAHFERQNEKIEAGELKGTCLHLDTAVITNGGIDMLYQAEHYPAMAYNNTYDLHTISEDEYHEALDNFTKPDGCRDQILQCRALGAQYDPDELNLNSTVNEICAAATIYCFTNVLGAYSASGRSPFDIANQLPNPYPPAWPTGWASRAWVQQALGARVNFTANSYLTQSLFRGDMVRRAGLQDLEYLLSRGIKVALIHGDRDYRCPWNGGEQLTLAANWPGAAAYRKAGYEEIRVNATYIGGVVKQHGLLSFSRVFDAGHSVSWYQPETSMQLFNRAVFNRDISTGKQNLSRRRLTKYSSQGPLDAWSWRNKLPASPEPVCYLFDFGTTCTQDQADALVNGTAEIENFVIVKPAPGGGPIGSGTGGI